MSRPWPSRAAPASAEAPACSRRASQTDDAMPDFNKPAGGSIGRPEGGGWVGGHISDDEKGGE